MSVPHFAVEVCLRLSGDECGECPGEPQLLAQQAGGRHGAVDRYPGGGAEEDVDVAVGRGA